MTNESNIEFLGKVKADKRTTLAEDAKKDHAEISADKAYWIKHGANHWARVFHHGKYIAQRREADLLVVELFAFLHDSCRFDEGRDLKHGERGAEFAYGMNGNLFHLTSTQLDDLCFAIRHHSGGDITTNATIQTCWDSDRLDLGRVGIVPSSKYISNIASEMIDYALDLSIK